MARLRPIYRRDGWILCTCQLCGRRNYCEPHGTTAKCACSEEWTEHSNIPRDEYVRGYTTDHAKPRATRW